MSILISDEWKGYSRELERENVRATVNHFRMYGYGAIVDGVEMSVNTNHIEREWREVRKAIAYVPATEFPDQLSREVFRLQFFGRLPKRELPYIFLEKMAESVQR